MYKLSSELLRGAVVLTATAVSVLSFRLPARSLMMSTASEVSSAAPPSWAILQQQLRSMGRDFEAQKEAIESGDFGAHTDAKVRLFGHRPEDVRVTFYRDTAAWCPYCQKTWLLLEEKRIPFRVEKINMRSYGAKPKEFLEKVPNGLLPAMELDGKLMTDSQRIMVTLENVFDGPEYDPEGYLTLPTIRKDAALMSRAEELLRLERELFSAWCQWCFRPDFGDMNKRNFEEVLGRVDAALGDLPGPFFMGEEMSIVDLVYVSHVERQVSSLLYWKGYQIRSHRGAEDERYPNINVWFDAFETRENGAYMATKSDHFTHVKDIPPQYGPSFFTADFSTEFGQRMIGAIDGGVDRDAAAASKGAIDGKGILGSLLGQLGDGRSAAPTEPEGGVPPDWRLPLPPIAEAPVVVLPPNDPGEAESRMLGAERLIFNHEAVVRFALRGAGEPGRPSYSAPLADPNAVPSDDPTLKQVVDELLRSVAAKMVLGENPEQLSPTLDTAPELGIPAAQCLDYLRSRVGVPRDMIYPAARQFRAHLAWAMEQAAHKAM
uniref:GST N-terminal domain-containing protein n=1 Tax=Pinguiococcus pyrenoidosus TaxID=172671 RepID=A0A7R9Y8T1_9STRA|mmetsp:Transcript_13045/g.48421  ORF Transcript_13045/g.48421 Transcript_13045/m.48421 type:complete len:547 (+) Transcript_13045:73-1713(+)